MTTTSAPARNGTRRPSRPIVLLIPVPGSSVIHDLWAGTKLLVVFGISVLLTFYPGWVTIGMMAALVLAAARIAHIPRAVALALALRAFPMLIDEFQVLYAARRLRPKRMPPSRKARRQRHARELIDLLAAAITVTLRRADEMGDAITARGGTGQLSAHPGRPKLADWVTLAITAMASGTAVAIESLILHS